MLFNSLHFALFFPIVFALYFLINPKYRWVLLLIASYYFYMSWNPIYILLILFSTFIDYFVAIFIERTEEKNKRKFLLYISLSANLGLLFIFKYYNFFNGAISDFADLFGYEYSHSVLNILLPVGISFYTFQTLSYTIDVYKKIQPAQKHFGKFALYVSFFPQLVAGPIERSTHLMPQFDQTFQFDYSRITDGLKLMFWGLFKKVVIADRLSLIVNQVYENPAEHDGFALLLATVLFAFQIYCDFSGYSDVAIGCAKVFGFDLMENFRIPYYSKSISEFWKRWHISLSTWFRDYVYIPLGGNRTVKWRWYFNLFITFFISGIWHGAAWTFVIWGALHGAYLIFAIVFHSGKETVARALGLCRNAFVRKAVQIITTFLLVDFAWIFFRASSLPDAMLIIRKIFTMDLSINSWIMSLYTIGVDKNGLIISFLSIFLMEVVHFYDRSDSFIQKLNGLSMWKRWSIYYFFIFYFLFFGTFSQQDFIYFQF
uniref:MBOAT family O-acyltransferase n=1 Tax=Roseihalotalea indica TaxID=2867963 RepID=A0AA49JIK3_9BACT|nr:MBOAT family O-acyltransferase [Tunicatimonas sp. TK19036]